MSWIWTMGVLLITLVLPLEVTSSRVHKVGDSAGWTTLIPVDYAKWASSQNFHVRDSLLFSYNTKFHNVLQVNKQQYDSCNASSPAASYNSGADSIALKRPGTFYFLCGFPGHCQLGQKVEIKVMPVSSSLLAPSSGPSPSPLPNGPAPTPSLALPRIYHAYCLPLALAVGMCINLVIA